MSAYTAYLLQSVEDEIERFRSRPLQRLRFQVPIEEKYHAVVGARKARIQFRSGLFSLILFDLFLLGDWFLIRPEFLYALFIRLGLVTPIMGLLLFTVRENRSPLLREGSTAAIACVGVVSTLLLGFGHHSVFIVQVEPTVTIILILLTVILRVDPVPSAIAILFTLVANTLAIIFYYPIALHDSMTSSLTLYSAALLLSVANYMDARAVRLSYLLQWRGELQAELLRARNSELRRISERDELTGLSSRYRYERYVDVLFKRAVDEKTPFSVVMVDVDHFKRVNDVYGHVYGDRVLERVGSLIQQALRAEDDFAARYGGEEFIVLLPQTDQAAALKVAERIRTLVQVAGSPAFSRDVNESALFTTVSCGVMTCIPTEEQTPQMLVEAADRALYQAKSEGRNRVCCVNTVLAA